MSSIFQNFTAARNAIFDHFLANFSITELPITYDNLPFDSSMATEFLRITANEISYNQETLASSTNRTYSGNIGITFQIFTATGQTTNRSDEISNEIFNIFSRNDSPIDVRSINVSPTFADSDSDFFQKNMIINGVYRTVR